MSSLDLKIIACVTMLLDHIGFLLFPEYTFLRLIGRISFPLFAFLIAEGFIKTKNIKNYLKRLFIFGLISQIPYLIFEKLAGVENFNFNIMFSLALGVVALLLLTSKKNIYIKILGSIGILTLTYFGEISYGVYGILSIVGSYIFIKNKKAGMVSLSILPFMETIRLFFMKIYFLQFFAVFSLIPIYFYNGKQGKKISRWWFYWFYPVHMLVLSGIFLIIK